MKKQGISLYEINPNVYCLNCGHKGAIQSYGTWYESGLGDDSILKEYKDKPFMSHTMGFGGTIPWQCLNCGNIGLIDFGGLEGYKKAFKSIRF